MSEIIKDGFLLIDKPFGWTSFDCVKRIRGLLGGKVKVGHGGTLDPFATGLLVVGVGRGTKFLQSISDGSKRYIADVAFGVSTETLDLDAAEVVVEKVQVDEDAVKAALVAMIGEMDQVPPNFSALKVSGMRSYSRARSGESFELPPRKITIFSASGGALCFKKFGFADFEVPCFSGVEFFVSKGTYIRAIARDLGLALGVKAVLSSLSRTGISSQDGREFSLSDAILFSKETQTSDIINAIKPIL